MNSYDTALFKAMPSNKHFTLIVWKFSDFIPHQVNYFSFEEYEFSYFISCKTGLKCVNDLAVTSYYDHNEIK